MEDHYWQRKIQRLQQSQDIARQTGDTSEVRELEIEIQNATAARDRDRERRIRGEIP